MVKLLAERSDIDKQISKLAPAIEYLSKLCTDLPAEPPMPSELDLGLADAIRLAFKTAIPASLTPTEVRDKLREQGFHLDKYANEMPPIHNTILRLLKKGEIEEDVPRREGKCYKWVNSLTRALLEIDPNMNAFPFSSLVAGVQEQVKADTMRELKKMQKDMGMDVTAYVAGRKYKKE